MIGFKVLLLSALSAVSVGARALDKTQVETRDTCVYTCGSVCYWQVDIDDALAQGYGYLQAGTTAGSNKYPHQYNDYEGFDFSTASPWYEFPILSSDKVYTAGSPGADRVIFNKNGAFTAMLTHTGASGNNFVECTKN